MKLAHIYTFMAFIFGSSSYARKKSPKIIPWKLIFLAFRPIKLNSNWILRSSHTCEWRRKFRRIHASSVATREKISLNLIRNSRARIVMTHRCNQRPTCGIENEQNSNCIYSKTEHCETKWIKITASQQRRRDQKRRKKTPVLQWKLNNSIVRKP